MFAIMILSYAIIAFVDIKVTYHKQDKSKIIVYFTLMSMACVISIASQYMGNVPSIAEGIKSIVFKLIGK